MDRFLFRARRAQRGSVAHAVDGLLGDLQGLRHSAADLRLRGPAIPAARQVSRRAEDRVGDGTELNLLAQRLLDLRLQHCLQILRRDRADELEANAVVAADYE